MDFSWTPDQLELRKRVISFAEVELNDGNRKDDEQLHFSIEKWKQCAVFGILGGNVPTAYGGQARDVLTNILTMEALGQGCHDNGLTLGVNAQMWTVQEPLITFGSEAQKQAYLPKLCSGELIAADAITEENAGSDALSMQTVAKKVDGGYELNGKKCYIGMAPIAGLFLVFALTQPDAGQWGISVFLVERDTPGLSCSENREKMGLRSLPTGDVILEDCFVPDSQRLGGEGIGMSLFSHTMEWERSFILASHVGAMEAQLQRCVDYAKTRKQFGESVGSFQSVSHRIADMRLRLETSRLLMYKAAYLKQKGDTAALESTLANLHISESFVESSLAAIRTHGARGYLSEFEVERDLRDSVGGVIYAGTSDIQRNMIAKLLGLK